eukprot:maker-scaffold_30-snap-gene-3.32-mRNA-1 protein AED:0.18 eAED:0.21 QI:0/0/0/0.66/0/0/3/0/174
MSLTFFLRKETIALTKIGILNHISETFRPDISFNTNRLSTFTQSPSYYNLILAKKVSRYLPQMTKYGILLKRRMERIHIDVYADSSWKFYQQTVQGHIIFLNKAAVCWKSKKQTIIVKSNIEAEVVGLSRALSSTVWFLKILDFLENKVRKLRVRMDSMSAIKLLQVQTQSDKT